MRATGVMIKLPPFWRVKIYFWFIKILLNIFFSKNLKLIFLYVPYRFGCWKIKLENTFFQNLTSNFGDGRSVTIKFWFFPCFLGSQTWSVLTQKWPKLIFFCNNEKNIPITISIESSSESDQIRYVRHENKGKKRDHLHLWYSFGNTPLTSLYKIC